MAAVKTAQSDHVLMCKQWWRVCWMYGDQEKYYRQLYGRRDGAGTARVTRTLDAAKKDDDYRMLQRQSAYHEMYGLDSSRRPLQRRSAPDLPDLPTVSATVPMQRLPPLGGFPSDVGLPVVPSREVATLPKKRLRNGETVSSMFTTTTTLTVQRQIPASPQ